MESIDKLFTVEMLATLTGAVLAVRLVVEYTKDYVKTWAPALPTRIYALLWAYIVLYGTGFLLEQLGNGMWFAHIFNGFAVAVTAGFMERPKENR